jgi:AAA+ ATPase superfamily predicted ATPase
MGFIGRQHELGVLEDAWRSPQSGFIPIYGRRRVGKSELILRFIEGKTAVYAVGKRAPAALQMREMLEAAAKMLEAPVLAQVAPSSWRQILETVTNHRKDLQKLVLVLDEFQWMVETSPELPSVLQELWDRFWSRSNDILLILCGSYLGFMEREVLGRNSPLFGRRTAQILLRPFNHIEAREFHPELAMDDHARIYAICGGIPAYLRAFKQDRSVEQNIIATLLEETGPLAQEPDFLLREELRDLIPYHAVLTGLARGSIPPKTLARLASIESRALNYHLGNLINLGYVQRRHPLTGPQPNAKSVRYALDDPLLRFWFRFIFPNLNILRPLGPAAAFTEVIRPDLESYLGLCFDRLCREALPYFYVAEGVRSAFTVGEYWDRHVQIEVVGWRDDNWTDIGECKWGSVDSIRALAEELDCRVKRYPNRRGASIGKRLFLRNTGRGVTAPAGFRLHTLADIYNLRVHPV